MKLMTSLSVVALAVTLLGLAPVNSHAAGPLVTELAQAQPIDINSATADNLRMLDGIGEARAAAIVKGRPYANKLQLVSKGIIPQAVYEKISDKIIAKQP